MAMVLCLVCTVSFGQLNVQKVNEYAKYEVVYKWWNGWGQIRYLIEEEQFVLFGASDNQFEDTMHSIVLGSSKEEVLISLNDLGSLKKSYFSETLIVNGMRNRPTKLMRGNGLMFSTEGVAGVSYALSYLNVNKAISAIENFNNSH